MTPPVLPSRPSILATCAIRFSAVVSAKRLRTARRPTEELGASPLDGEPKSIPAWLAPPNNSATSRGIPFRLPDQLPTMRGRQLQADSARLQLEHSDPIVPSLIDPLWLHEPHLVAWKRQIAEHADADPLGLALHRRRPSPIEMRRPRLASGERPWFSHTPLMPHSTGPPSSGAPTAFLLG